MTTISICVIALPRSDNDMTHLPDRVSIAVRHIVSALVGKGVKIDSYSYRDNDDEYAREAAPDLVIKYLPGPVHPATYNQTVQSLRRLLCSLPLTIQPHFQGGISSDVTDKSAAVVAAEHEAAAETVRFLLSV